ncbi:MAG: NAD(P)H-hydrate epimerase, partial [Actinobacteria bacterium]|nr:NAD(P)H-hydrate epimerase [Actinomycetota bacterium]NIS37123.1 NAD(P)H-hydrate epimerase [Actinomycetota bacterium]NIU22708.1 NAD(P)H-hydrate epimerase [Actinomycetota bacterium]NIU71575.1 NAD(P)H-hydrate epimerase [Actinomycetota bacterium]NIV90914.1 NAD(P)H-hydrate epimerase [Actinomycetota bacterium]
IVDAMVGYGLSNALRGRAAALAALTADTFTVSLDYPSGHGFPGAVHADATLTLALPKESLRGLEPLYLADLGLPAALWSRMG